MSKSLPYSMKDVHYDNAKFRHRPISKENNMLKQQIQALMQDNSILKRGIQIQHERQKEFDDKNQEVQQLKQLLSQYQEQLRRLEVTNYTLSMHLQQAQPNSSVSGHYNRDVC